jgi:hypothetical protein
VQTRIQENLEFALDHYAEMLGSAPTYVTYFNRIIEASTQDASLDAVYSVVGTDSPIRYRRVEKLPVYNLQQVSLALQDGTFGMEADITSECVVLPHTIKPYSDDLVVVFVPGGFGYTIFQVTVVEPSITGSKRFFKLSIKRIEKTLEQCEAQMSEETIFSTQDYEAGRRAIIPRTDSVTLHRAREQRLRLVTEYRRLFYDSNVSSFVCNHNGLHIVHFGIHELLESGRVLEFDRPFYDVLTIMTPPNEGLYNILLERYPDTIYGCVRSHEYAIDLECDSFITLPLNEKGSVFKAYNKQYSECWDNSTGLTPNNSLYYSEAGFAIRIRNNIIYNELNSSGDEISTDMPGYELENFIIRDINGTFTNISTLVDDANRIRVKPSLRSFLLIPCVLFALRRTEDLLTALVQER